MSDQPATGGIEGANAPATGGEDARAPQTFTGRDLSARATLAPGNYTLDYMAGSAERAVISVYGTDTWRDVLSRMARAFGSASPAMLSRLVPVGGGGFDPSTLTEKSRLELAALSGVRLVDARVGDESGGVRSGGGKNALEGALVGSTGRIVQGEG